MELCTWQIILPICFQQQSWMGQLLLEGFVGDARTRPLTLLKGYTHRLRPKLLGMLCHLAPTFLSGYTEPLWFSWQATLFHTLCFFSYCFLYLQNLRNPRNYSMPIATNVSLVSLAPQQLFHDCIYSFPIVGYAAVTSCLAACSEGKESIWLFIPRASHSASILWMHNKCFQINKWISH